MSDRLDSIMEQAVADGLLPATATRPVQSERPWPVVLLTALGAWLAAVPLLSVVSLLLGDWISRGIGPYLVGLLLLAAAVVILRARGVALFVEQLAVPTLLVGQGSLAFGLFRDLPERGGAALLALVTLALAVAIVRPWLRTLLGAASALLVSVALVPTDFLDALLDGSSGHWLSAHGVLLLWLGAVRVQQRVLNDGARARYAIVVEQIGAGWLLALLFGLALLSGATFMVGGGIGGLAGEVARELGPRSGVAWQSFLMSGASTALTLIAGGIAVRAWPSVRRPPLLGVAAVLMVLAWFLPTLGAVTLLLALTATTGRLRLAAAAALAAAWVIGSFYYQLHWTLMTKALVLVSMGGVLGALARSLRGDGDPAASDAGLAPATRRVGMSWLIAVSAVATLAVANVGIWQKERLIEHGQPVFIELAPVDPRSLMQGDYMRLNFRLPSEVASGLVGLVTLDRPRVVARLDARGVATLLRLHRDEPLGEGELLIELTPKGGRWIVVTDGWHFREGDAKRWEAARYGDFRVTADGKALLVGMADAQLNTIDVIK